MPRRPTHLYTPPLHEPQLARAERRARGVYYTPPEVARNIVDWTLAPLVASSEERLRILDPACGGGALLNEAARHDVQLFGIDLDPAAVELARQNVSGAELWCGDSLFDARLEALAPFDAIVANPPYLNIRELTKSCGAEYIRRLRERFRTARGSFDLYVLFLERALELLRPGGRCGIIVPNKWATLDYARPCRELLASQATIEQVVDLSDQRVFRQASVYPHVLIFAKQRSVTASPAIHVGGRFLDVESRVPTMPLGEVARLHCGTTGFAATKIACRLIDVGQASCLPLPDWQAGSLPHCCDFITSGNIDRYQIRLGNVRYLNRTYARPQLPMEIPELSAAKRQLFSSSKIVIAGLSKRIEAAWDDAGLTLGVQVFAAAETQIDPQYLLALLNSKLLSYLFRTRFAAKRLAGDYLAINKGQLAQLPIAVGQNLSCLFAIPAGQVLPYVVTPAIDAEIDRCVYQLYQLTGAEIEQVENHFAEIDLRAA